MAELLFVPLKKSSDVDIVKPLKNLIQSTYNTGESHEDYSEALNELSRLRTNAIWKVFEKSSLEILYSYYDQLASLESKLPPQEVQIPFKWKDAFDKGSIFGGRMSLTLSSLAYERMCILFNVAAQQSALAAQQPLDTEESLKLAAKLLQQAAGVFGYLKANILLAVHQETTPDLSPDTLGALASLMLAQAQEVIAYKCIRDEMKDSMVAKVCAQAEELYTEALRAMQRESLRALWERTWLPALQAKQALFKGLAHYYQAQVCRQNKAVGEEIARLTLANELLKSAAGPSGAPPGPAADLLPRAVRQLAAASKDNDFIYHERIPDARSLEPVARAAVAKALPPPERWAPGAKDLFAGLVPAAVHQALQASGARRAELVNAEIAKLRDATQLLNSILASLSLPACIEQSDDGLPASIRDKAAAVRELGGLPALERLMQELPELLQRNKDMLDEAERMLREEEEADAALREQFGARWTRTPSAKLTEAFRANADKYRQIIDNAVRADAIVQQKYQQHKENMVLLSGSEGELVAGVPAAPEGAGAGEAAAARLRRLMSAVAALKARRDTLEAALADVTLDLREQFLSALAADGALDEPAATAAALGAKLQPLSRQVAETLAEQESLVSELQAAHSELLAARGGASGRDHALGRLAAASDAYQDLTGNLKEGVKFYNDLTQLLIVFQNKVSDFCFARKTEKEELLKDLTQEASRPARPAPTPPQRSVDEPPAVSQRTPPPRPPPPGAPAAPAASTAPSASLPYPQQPQGMPVPYGPGAPYAYFAPPPMPALYNPYATLPYPHHARMPPPQPYQPYQYPPPQPGYQPPPAGYNPYPQQ